MNPIPDIEHPLPLLKGEAFMYAIPGTKSEGLLVEVLNPDPKPKGKGTQRGVVRVAAKLKDLALGKAQDVLLQHLKLPPAPFIAGPQRARIVEHAKARLAAWKDGTMRPELRGAARKAALSKIEAECGALIKELDAPAAPAKSSRVRIEKKAPAAEPVKADKPAKSGKKDGRKRFKAKGAPKKLPAWALAAARAACDVAEDWWGHGTSEEADVKFMAVSIFKKARKLVPTSITVNRPIDNSPEEE